MLTVLKPAGPGDALALLDIHRKAFAALLEKYQDYETNPALMTLEGLQQRISCGQRDYWFVLEDGRQAGFICVKRLENACRVSPIGLLPKCQGKGIGRRAMLLLEKEYPETRRWVLGTILQEPGLCSFYESLGYEADGNIWEIKQGMNEVGYEKILF